jgi:metal-responsive CopG/Arc/MetJ family transcriptional regulator
MSTVTVNISFQDSLLRDIDRVARGEARTRSELLREAAREYIRRRNRWRDIFAAGQRIARQKGLKPDDVAAEIAAFRATDRQRA